MVNTESEETENPKNQFQRRPTDVTTVIQLLETWNSQTVPRFSGFFCPNSDHMFLSVFLHPAAATPNTSHTHIYTGTECVFLTLLSGGKTHSFCCTASGDLLLPEQVNPTASCGCLSSCVTAVVSCSLLSCFCVNVCWRVKGPWPAERSETRRPWVRFLLTVRGRRCVLGSVTERCFTSSERFLDPSPCLQRHTRTNAFELNFRLNTSCGSDAELCLTSNHMVFDGATLPELYFLFLLWWRLTDRGLMGTGFWPQMNLGWCFYLE